MTKKKEDAGRPVDVLPFDVSDKPKKSYVPDGFDTVEEFLEDMRETYDLDVEYDRQNRDEAVDDKQFAAGEQWDPEVLRYRKGLPCLTINTVPQFIAQLVGDWRQERNGIKVVPAENGDVDTASIRGDLIRAIETKSRAGRVYNSAFESAVTCGDGAFRIAVEYARDDVFDQEIYVRPIDDALSVVWDRMSVDPTGRDARHCFVDDTLPVAEFKKKFGEAEYSTLHEKVLHNRTSGAWYVEDEARITEYWRIIERDRFIGLFEDGSIHILEGSDKDIMGMVEKHGQIVKSRISPCSYAQMHLCTGFQILAGPYEYRLSRLPIIRMTGRVQNIAGRRVRYGLVRFMKDAVRLRNFWRSIAAEQLGYAPKAQWFATESAIEGREEDFRKAHLSRDPLLIGNDEAEFGKNLIRLDPPVPQMALLNEAQVNAQDMKDITGLHDASLGIKSNETSGKAIMARQREGDVASLTFYDNGNESILEGGDVINQLISSVYDGTRILRIIGEDEAVKFIKANDPSDPNSPDLSVGNYDTAMTSGPSFTTRRMEAAEAMMGAVQVYPEIMQVASDLIVKAQDWPGAEELSERLRKTIPPQLLTPEEQQEAGVQPQGQMVTPEMMDEVAKMQEELQKLKQQAAEQSIMLKNKEEENEIAWYKAKTDRIKALSDNEVDGNQLELDAIAEILEHARHEDGIEHEKEMADSDRDHEIATKSMDQAHQSTEAKQDREHASTENKENRRTTEKTAAMKKNTPTKK